VEQLLRIATDKKSKRDEKSVSVTRQLQTIHE